MPDNLGSNARINEKGRIIRESGEDFGINLADAVKLWPTPTTYDATPGGPGNHYHGLGYQAKHVDGSALNPQWVEWLMGFPDGWTDLGASATPSSR
jgi:hypothetical protein